MFYSAFGPQYLDHSNLERVGKLCRAKGIDSEIAVTAFQQWVKCQIASSPTADSLLVLVKFNVFRALLNNSKRLGFSTAREYLDEDALSPFLVRKNRFLRFLWHFVPSNFNMKLPINPCLDLLPDPVMRDNLIRARGAYNEEELCEI